MHPSPPRPRGRKPFPYQHTERRQPNLNFDPYSSFSASRLQAPSSPGERAREAARWLKEQQQVMQEDSMAQLENRHRALEQDRVNREKLRMDSRESLDSSLIPLLGKIMQCIHLWLLLYYVHTFSPDGDPVMFVFVCYIYIDNMLEDSVLFEENEKLIEAFEKKQLPNDIDTGNRKDKSASPDRSVGTTHSRVSASKPLRTPGVLILPRKIEKSKTEIDDDNDEHDGDDFKDAAPDLAVEQIGLLMPKKTNTRPSTAPTKRTKQTSYVASVSGVQSREEAEAKKKQERSKLLVEQRKKKARELRKKKEDELLAKEKLYRNKEVLVGRFQFDHYVSILLMYLRITHIF